MTLTEWMTPDPERVFIHTTMVSCARRMHEHGFRHLPVVDHDGALQGIVTDFAVDQAGAFVGAAWVPWEQEEHPEASAHMLKVDVAPHPDWPLAPVLRSLMRSWQDAAVVVDDQRRPIGILTERDVAMRAASVLPAAFLCVRRARSVIAVDADRDAKTAFDRMVQHRIRHVLLNERGKPVGVVSFRDIVGGRVTRGREVKLGELRRRDLVTATEGTPMAEIAARMAAERIGCMPIVDSAGRAVGVVTASDLLALVVAALEGRELPTDWDAEHHFAG